MAPEVKVSEPMVYKVTVTNSAGCTASDTVSIGMLCGESRVYIPNAITPNHDGNNDVFLLQGTGIKSIKHLRIYSRWGEILFERQNFSIGDRNAAWDGTFKGLMVPAGSYVYTIEMTCNEKIFSQKGTVTVIY